VRPRPHRPRTPLRPRTVPLRRRTAHLQQQRTPPHPRTVPLRRRTAHFQQQHLRPTPQHPLQSRQFYPAPLRQVTSTVPTLARIRTKAL
ncbi:hypothetical protein LTR17_008580, partial [Elasticomyces elasticus]